MNFVKKSVTLYTTASGNSLSIEVYEYFGNPGESDVYYLQAGIHGTEIIGTPVLYELMHYIEEHQSCINIICVPLCNPFATDSQIMGVQTGYNNIHTNTQNCLNYNRLGMHNSNAFENQMIEKLFELSQRATTIIDIHSSGEDAPFYMYAHRSCIDDATRFGMSDIITRDEGGKSFEDQNVELGKKAYTLELGPSRKATSDQVARGLQYLINYLFGAVSISSTIWENNQLQSIFSPYAGILVWQKNVGDVFALGETLALIYTREGKKNIVADVSGKFLIKNPIHAVFQNQEIGQILVDKN